MSVPVENKGRVLAIPSLVVTADAGGGGVLDAEVALSVIVVEPPPFGGAASTNADAGSPPRLRIARFHRIRNGHQQHARLLGFTRDLYRQPASLSTLE